MKKVKKNLLKQKIIAFVLIMMSIILVFIDTDITASIFIDCFAIPMFFTKINCFW